MFFYTSKGRTVQINSVEYLGVKLLSWWTRRSCLKTFILLLLRYHLSFIHLFDTWWQRSGRFALHKSVSAQWTQTAKRATRVFRLSEHIWTFINEIEFQLVLHRPQIVITLYISFVAIKQQSLCDRNPLSHNLPTLLAGISPSLLPNPWFHFVWHPALFKNSCVTQFSSIHCCFSMKRDISGKHIVCTLDALCFSQRWRYKLTAYSSQFRDPRSCNSTDY